MDRNIIQAELQNGPARVRVQTYHYAKPSEMVGKPSNHTLTLMTAGRQAAGFGQFYHPYQSRQMSALGDLIFIPAGHSLFGSGTGGPREMVACAFLPGTIDALATFERSWDDRELANCCDLRSARIADTMRRLGQEALSPGFGSDVLVDALTSALPIELARHFNVIRESNPIARGGLTPRQMRVIEEYVRDWPPGGVRVADLASLAGLSRGHFMRAFKQSAGQTVHNFVENIRLEQAENMLAHSEVPLKEIAHRLGFANPASFSLAFRRMTGETPGRYRATRRN